MLTQDIAEVKNGRIITRDGGSSKHCPACGLVFESKTEANEHLGQEIRELQARKANLDPDLLNQLKEMKSANLSYDSIDPRSIKIQIERLEDSLDSISSEARRKEIEKEIASLEAQLKEGETKDGGVGSGQKGHTTAEQISSKQGLSGPREVAHAKVRQALKEAYSAYQAVKGDLRSDDKTKKNAAWNAMQRLASMEEKLGTSPHGLSKKEILAIEHGSTGDSTTDNLIDTAWEGIKKFIEPAERTEDSTYFTPEEALQIAQNAGVDPTKVDMKEFQAGLVVEMEHQDLTNGDPLMTAKIVLAHLNEIPDYYTRLKKMEAGAKTKDSPDPQYMAERRRLDGLLKKAQDDGDTSKAKEIQGQINDLIKKGKVGDGISRLRKILKDCKAK